MAGRSNAIRSILTVLADGFSLAAGTTARILKLTLGDLTFTGRGGSNTLSFPDVVDTVVAKDTTDTLTNKTVSLDDNTVDMTSGALGDLVKHNGTKLVRFAKGTASQQIRVKSDGTDLEFFTGGNACFIGGTNEDPSAATIYLGVFGARKTIEGDTDNWRFPAAGTLSDLHIRVTNSPGVGDSWTVNFILDGTLENGGSDPQAAVSGAVAKEAEDTTNTLTVAKGQRLTTRWLEGGAANSTEMGWSALFTF